MSSIRASSHLSTSFVIISLFVLVYFGYVVSGDATNIVAGALLDHETRIGKEMTAALKIAAQRVNDINSLSSVHDHNKQLQLLLHFQNPGRSPLRAIDEAEKLVREKNPQFILHMGSWTETALIASIGDRAKVPIISFAGAEIEKPIMQKQWPFLVQMAPRMREQIKCIKDIVATSLHWRKVIVIYEVDSHGSDSGAFALLAEALSVSGVEIEHRLVLPPFSSLPDPETFIREEVDYLLDKQSRVFIVLKSSLEWGALLFREANEAMLVEKDSAWIVSDPLASLLDSVDASVISSMEGTLGVTDYFSENGRLYQEFKQNFKKVFRSDYPDEDNSEPSIYALRAYDSINVIMEAIEKSNMRGNSNPRMLLKSLLSSNFTGLSGAISFEGGELVVQPSAFKIVNVIGKKYKEVLVWSSEFGFSTSVGSGERLEKWFELMIWPGDLRRRAPKGWSMPNGAKLLKIGVPGRTTFEKFVKVIRNSSTDSYIYTGFCIDIFKEVLSILNLHYSLPYEFIPFDGSYDELVESVANKTFDAAVGDITILANRSIAVEFTQPFMESGLTMLVTVKSQAESTAWLFLKPFTGAMWAVTGAILLYTVLIVCLLERQVNPEFEGPWWNQFNTALWFTCSTLFFAHREKVYNNYTRIVVLVWLFLVLVLTSSYTANLSSMLTIPHLIPSVTDIQSLKDKNAKIGCDGDSFVRKYLESVLGFHPENIRNISSEYDYPKEFESRNISAAFLELPYQKAFVNLYCKGYTVAGNNSTNGDRFGGLGFAFQKGSPLAEDVSQAILTLSENGKLKELQLEYFSPSLKCLQNSDTVGSLGWQSFWGLFLFSAGISAICYLLFSIQRFYKRWCASNFLREARTIESLKLGVFVRGLQSRIYPSTVPDVQ